MITAAYLKVGRFMVSNTPKCLSRDAIKLIAVIFMSLSHIATFFLPQGTILQRTLLGLGSFTAISMCFFLVEGFSYTHSRKRYLGRLLLFAVIAQLPYQLLFESGGLNMLFSLSLCFLICLTVETVQNLFLKLLLIGLLLLGSTQCDWGIGAPIFTLLFLWSYGSRQRQKLAFLIPTLLFGLYNFAGRYGRISLGLCLYHTLLCMLGMGLAGFCILELYSGRKTKFGARFPKWFFYWFYPAHLGLLAFIKFCIKT